LPHAESDSRLESGFYIRTFLFVNTNLQHQKFSTQKYSSWKPFLSPHRWTTVDFGGTRREVCLAYLPEADLGDYVVVHVGFAISLISQAEARETQALLEEIAAQELPGSSKLPGS